MQVMHVTICQKLSLLWGGVGCLHHYSSGLWHICQTHLFGLENWSVMTIQHLLLTCDDDVLPIIGRSSKMAEEVATGEHLASRSWKLIGNADINIHSPISTPWDSVENLDYVDGDSLAVINGNPGCTFCVCVAYHITATPKIRAFVSVNTVACSKLVGIIP